MTAKSMVAAIMFLVMCVVSAVATGGDKLPASLDILQRQWPENAADVGFDCYTMCTAGCFAVGMTGDYCTMVCQDERAEDA
ncbi:hypothetical protein PAHAL_9G532600 [Panicum hallii]|jgi:hypothetical protein|uniref:Uncharacterized protein n=1 Tax=Panicum hallii TaxID=206008 RepID=A0A2T8I5K6_9POAL|nr:hypothetical protein PAHAL_9G532600 [Panicum hallii]